MKRETNEGIQGKSKKKRSCKHAPELSCKGKKEVFPIM